MRRAILQRNSHLKEVRLLLREGRCSLERVQLQSEVLPNMPEHGEMGFFVPPFFLSSARSSPCSKVSQSGFQHPNIKGTQNSLSLHFFCGSLA